MYFSSHMKCISDFAFRRNIRENISLVSSACRHNIILIFQQDKTHKLSHDSYWTFRNTLDEEQFSKEQMVVGLWHVGSESVCYRIQCNIFTSIDNQVLNLKSEDRQWS